MQISDLEIPHWVNWLAQDADGTWWGYQVEPLQNHSGWYENEVGQIIKLYSAAEVLVIQVMLIQSG